MRQLSLCIVSPDAFGAVSGGASGHAGGVERQTTLTAKWLAARGHDVSMIVWNEGQRPMTTIDGVRIISMCREDAGLPLARFFHPRWTSLARALAAANARVYYQNCAEYVTGQVALWCRRNARRFVYSVASDPECDPSLPALTRAHDRIFFRYGLRAADRIVTQTRRQQQMLLAGTGLASVVLPMPCPGPSTLAPRRFPVDRPRVVWVGRLSAEKRPEWLLDIAAAVPEASFEVAGPWSPSDPQAAAIVARAAARSNITVRGQVAREEMAGVYRDAAALVCTSAYEGFPNTFLEAWSFGVPVVATVDPEGLLGGQGLGMVSQTVGGLAAALRSLLSAPPLWESMSRRARAEYESRHTVDAALTLFESLFQDVDEGRAAAVADAASSVGA